MRAENHDNVFARHVFTEGKRSVFTEMNYIELTAAYDFHTLHNLEKELKSERLHIIRRKAFIYETVPSPDSVYNLPGVRQNKDIAIESTRPIDNPEQYDLRLKDIRENDFSQNPWYPPSFFIFAFSLSGGIAALFWKRL